MFLCILTSWRLQRSAGGLPRHRVIKPGPRKTHPILESPRFWPRFLTNRKTRWEKNQGLSLTSPSCCLLCNRALRRRGFFIELSHTGVPRAVHLEKAREWIQQRIRHTRLALFDWNVDCHRTGTADRRHYQTVLPPSGWSVSSLKSGSHRSETFWAR